MSVVKVSQITIPASNFLAGNATATTTESQIPLPAGYRPYKGITVTASPANTANCLIGPLGYSASGYILAHGASVQIEVDTPLVGIVSASGSQTYSFWAI